MSELPESLNAFRVELETFLEARSIPLQLRNRNLKVKADTTWARLSLLSIGSTTASLGQKWIRDRGIFVVSLFFPLGQGTHDADKLSYLLRDTFSEWQYNYLETGIGEVIEVPSTQDFYHVNINLPYRHK